jgi:hypothetical protein
MRLARVPDAPADERAVGDETLALEVFDSQALAVCLRIDDDPRAPDGGEILVTHDPPIIVDGNEQVLKIISF